MLQWISSCGWISPPPGLPAALVMVAGKQVTASIPVLLVLSLRKQDLWVHRPKSLYSLERLGQGSCLSRQLEMEL